MCLCCLPVSHRRSHRMTAATVYGTLSDGIPQSLFFFKARLCTFAIAPFFFWLMGIGQPPNQRMFHRCFAIACLWNGTQLRVFVKVCSNRQIRQRLPKVHAVVMSIPSLPLQTVARGYTDLGDPGWHVFEPFPTAAWF